MRRVMVAFGLVLALGACGEKQEAGQKTQATVESAQGSGETGQPSDEKTQATVESAPAGEQQPPEQ